MINKSLWYINRLRKMNGAEILKRIVEVVRTYFTRIRYRNPSKWPYARFAGSGELIMRNLPGAAVDNDWQDYQIFNFSFNLTRPIDWFFSDKPHCRWPADHHSVLDYRQGNPYGSARINWELNRLQFLPTLAVVQEKQAKKLLVDWLEQNPYLHGPSYLSAMEVAIRWISIYRAICLFKNPLEEVTKKDLTGLARVSGEFIESHLSTHSSAGNHLIVEAVGLFWLGKALETETVGKHWIKKSRTILKERLPEQVNPDGSNQEQSFWYLGFVVDAIFHYLLLEDRQLVPVEIVRQVENSMFFIGEMILENGAFPNYGDCDDGFVFRSHSNYSEPFFLNLLKIGNCFLGRPEDHRTINKGEERLAFFKRNDVSLKRQALSCNRYQDINDKPVLRTFEDGGMTLMRFGKGRILFRHARLGLGNTCGHGHADALSILFDWHDVPVLVDLGSGQYHGDPALRNFFRSTIAHNTIEIDGKNQAKILGPFLWKKSYNTKLIGVGTHPELFAEATHDGYFDKFTILSSRKIRYISPKKFEIEDRFSGPGGKNIKGAFHLGDCDEVRKTNSGIEAQFETFTIAIQIPDFFGVEIYFGSNNPFMGWRSTIYGAWKPSFSVIYSGEMTIDHRHTIKFNLVEK